MSASGGMDIEEVARQTPEKIIRYSINPFIGLPDYLARRFAFALFPQMEQAASSSILAGSINGEWKAPPTFSGRARFAPAAFISSQAFSIPGTEPEITICPGQL